MADKTVRLQYYAQLREERGLSQETVATQVSTVRELYAKLKEKHRFSLPAHRLRVAVNDEFVSWETPIKSQDTITFIPPVAGG